MGALFRVDKEGPSLFVFFRDLWASFRLDEEGPSLFVVGAFFLSLVGFVSSRREEGPSLFVVGAFFFDFVSSRRGGSVVGAFFETGGLCFQSTRVLLPAS